jgi:glutamine synthetase
MQLEYVWVDGKNEIRTKTKVIGSFPNIKLSDIPNWNYDGSSTYQASTESSEVFLYPMKLYNNPFVKNGYFVICKTSDPLCSMSVAESIFSRSDDSPMFGLEQEFFIIDNRTGKPLGWPLNGEPKPQGDYYCSVGSGRAFGREYLNECMNMLLEMEVPITGMNYEVAPGQAEFQVCDIGMDACHGMLMLRYVLARVGEKYDYRIEYDPKPIQGNWNGSGCHVNFSTKPMRDDNGYDIIKQCMEYLSNTHVTDLKLYGKNNEKRLTGKHETSSMEKFSYGVASRAASVRIPTSTHQENKGYFEDRRPASNIDPYLVCANIYNVCCLDHKSLYDNPIVQKIIARY